MGGWMDGCSFATNPARTVSQKLSVVTKPTCVKPNSTWDPSHPRPSDAFSAAGAFSAAREGWWGGRREEGRGLGSEEQHGLEAGGQAACQLSGALSARNSGVWACVLLTLAAESTVACGRRASMHSARRGEAQGGGRVGTTGWAHRQGSHGLLSSETGKAPRSANAAPRLEHGSWRTTLRPSLAAKVTHFQLGS